MPVKTESIEKKKMEVSIQNKNLVFTIPLDLLVWTQENRDNPYKIDRDRSMERWLINHALDFGGDSEAGWSEFEHYLDRLFDEAYESAEDWISMPEYDAVLSRDYRLSKKKKAKK